uniref:Uncharacterized protein n=1 Tax=viral metagenome TaxID=1070528 RepID=A0A6C0EDF6_9ZZZZ
MNNGTESYDILEPIDENEESVTGLNIIDEEHEEYVEDEEAELNTQLINVFIKYYNMTYPERKITNLFHGINVYNPIETNHPLELFYELIDKYNYMDKYNSERAKVFLPEKYKNSSDECYALKIDDKIEYMSEFVFPLLLCIIDKYLDRNWIIINLK